MFGLDLGNLISHLNLDTRQFDRNLYAAQARIKAFSQSMEQIGRTWTRRVTMPIIAFGTAGAYSFARFDDAMTKSLAIFGDVSQEMRAEMEKTAIQLSKRSVQSATDLAKAYFYLGSAGFTTEQSLRALGAVERFAVAGSFDLSTATTLAADAQKALGMTSRDAQENLRHLTHVTDVLSGANTLANANIYQFSAALTNEAGPSMKAWNISLEEGVAVLAAYADQGIKAEAAGSAFGRMLRLMMKGYQDNEAVWKRFNINLYDAQGQLKPLADIIGNLTDTLGRMSAEQKVATLDMMGFQARSQQVILPLLGLSDTIRDYNKRLEEMSGLTKELAERNMRSFLSQLTVIWHYIKVVGRDIGRLLAPYILKVGEAVKALTNCWSGLDDTLKLTVVKWGLVAAAIGPVLIIMAKLLSTIGLMSIGFAALGKVIAPVAAGLWVIIGPAMAVLGVFALIVAAAYTLRAAWNQGVMAIKERLETMASFFQQTFEYIANSVLGDFIRWFAKDFVMTFHEVLDTVKKDASNFTKDLGGLFRGIRALAKGEDFWRAFTEGWEAAESQLESARKTIIDTFETSKIYIKAFGEATKEHLTDLAEAMKKQLGQDAAAAIELVTQKLRKMNEEGLKILPPDDVAETKARMDELMEGLKRYATEGAKAVEDGKLADAYRSVRSQMGRMTEEVYEAEMNALVNLKTLYESYGMDVQTLTKWYEEQVEILEIEYSQAVRGVAGGFKAAGMQIRREIQNWGERVYEFSMSFRDSIASGLESTMRDFKNWKTQLLAIFEEIYWSGVRIAFIQPAAGWLAKGMTAFAGAAMGAVFPSPVPSVTSPTYGQPMPALQRGGTIAKTGWAVVHEGETYSGVSNKSKERIEIRIHNEYSEEIERREITRAEEYFVSDQRIIDVTIQRMQTDIKYRRSVAQAARS